LKWAKYRLLGIEHQLTLTLRVRASTYIYFLVKMDGMRCGC